MADTENRDLTTREDSNGGHVTKAATNFTGIVLSSSRALKSERNKIFYLTIGAALSYLVIVVALGSLLADRWIHISLISVGLLVIAAVVIRDFREANRSTTIRLPDEAATIKIPVGEADSATGTFEIEMYWGYRPTAHNDLHEAMLMCTEKLFIAGIALNTIGDALCDPEVVASLATRSTNSAAFRITVVSLTEPDNVRSLETGREVLANRLQSGQDSLRRFYTSFDARVPAHVTRPLVNFRTYDDSTFPRHFLMQADNNIYAGSYLSHTFGSHSYLLKLREVGASGLYNLFESEILYLMAHSTPYTPTWMEV